VPLPPQAQGNRILAISSPPRAENLVREASAPKNSTPNSFSQWQRGHGGDSNVQHALPKAGMDPRTSARGVANVDFVEEVGGGLNLKRPKFVTIMDRIEVRQASPCDCPKGSTGRNGSGFVDSRALLVGPSVWLAQLPQEVERSVGRGCPELNGASAVCAGIPASTMDEPRTETVHTMCRHLGKQWLNSMGTRSCFRTSG
jgi:hypothetical protein